MPEITKEQADDIARQLENTDIGTVQPVEPPASLSAVWNGTICQDIAKWVKDNGDKLANTIGGVKGAILKGAVNLIFNLIRGYCDKKFPGSKPSH
jgi:hypothetical protein